MPKAKKAAVYCRVSTVHQVDKDSLPMQRNDMINYAKYVLNIEDYEVFEDAGYSGKNTDRPAFQDMMTRIHQGEFSHILVWKIDRISRNLLDFATMYEECKKLGVTFVSKNEQFDTSTAMGEAMLKIILVFAELERNMTSERVSATMNARAADGKWNGGQTPFGYSYDKKTDTFSIIPDEEQIVLKIKDMYLRNHSLVTTACELNDTGCRTRRGNKWSPYTIGTVLNSPFYRGVYRYNYHDESSSSFSIKDQNEWILCTKHHPAILSPEDCEAIDFWRYRNRRLPGNNHHAQRKHVHIFADIVFCGQCGAKYVSSMSRAKANGYQPSMYNCSGRRSNSECHNKYMTDITLGGFIFNYVSNMMRLRREFKPSWTVRKISKVLMTGSMLNTVTISPTTLSSIRVTLLETVVGTTEYHSAAERATRKSSKNNQQESTLQAEIDRNERAMNRLEHLFLFSDDVMSRMEYLRKRKAFQDAIMRAKEDLTALKKHSILAFNLSDERFIQDAAQLIFRDNLKRGNFDFQDLVNATGKEPLKEFITTIISRIIILNGHVTDIEFTNGQIHNFIWP